MMRRWGHRHRRFSPVIQTLGRGRCALCRAPVGIGGSPPGSPRRSRFTPPEQPSMMPSGRCIPPMSCPMAPTDSTMAQRSRPRRLRHGTAAQPSSPRFCVAPSTVAPLPDCTPSPRSATRWSSVDSCSFSPRGYSTGSVVTVTKSAICAEGLCGGPDISCPSIWPSGCSINSSTGSSYVPFHGVIPCDSPAAPGPLPGCFSSAR